LAQVQALTRSQLAQIVVVVRTQRGLSMAD
jgi:hypothetical protein